MRTLHQAVTALVVLSSLGAPVGAGGQSLYREGAGAALLFVDHRAHAVNDIVTIVIVEQAASSVTANTKTEKDSSRFAAITQFPTAFDALAAVTIKPIVKNWLGYKPPSQFAQEDLRLALESKANHEGKGNIDRSSRVTGQIPARVIKVLDNGNMVVEGRRALAVNNETQVMTLSGVIRPEDVTSNNTILSSQIADAEIQMEGRGVLAEAQRPGILFRFLDWLNLF
jgi:flagellar L-ring protein precursor FlgH